VIVFIDGYNLIKQVLGAKRISHKQRDLFVDNLCDYFRKRKLKGVIVFDGGESCYPYHVKKGLVEVIFSGYKESADDVILRYLDEYKGHEVVLVSSDRVLRDYASTLGKESIKADEFYRRFVDRPEKKDVVGIRDAAVHKLSEAVLPELDRLMIMSTDQIELKESDHLGEKLRERSSRKISKKGRKQHQIFNKLK